MSQTSDAGYQYGYDRKRQGMHHPGSEPFAAEEMRDRAPQPTSRTERRAKRV